MALQLTAPTARLAMAVCLSTLLAACASDQGPTVVVVEAPPAQINDRFSEEGLTKPVTAATEPQSTIRADQLEPDAPSSYTVVKGDTLWDISDRFLKEPWLWPEIWSYNPQIENPHLIYPGDLLALEYVNGRPTLTLSRNGQSLGSTGNVLLDADGNTLSGDRIRLSPRIRTESLDDAIPTIAGDSIQQFLVHPRVVDARTLENAPYIVGNYDNRLISAVGHRVFVRGELNRDQTAYGIFRRNKELRDPTTGALLGHEVTHVADARLLSIGDPSALAITLNKMETMAGDILLPSHEGSITHTYTPRLPALTGEGRIVSLVNAISQTGRDQVVVLNIGSESKIQEGDMLAIESRGNTIVDSRGKDGNERITLPNQRTGVMMVFRTYDKVSYALVMESTRPVMINDIVTGI
ncbi:LysM peptidoglycan-binding domain-containing protein [Granulosicoccus sp. 3-233]|uniref:LysM peptidoglycan-binding domain-containing protein n=1 Tax=Granulosicoccus sp. 3-233 TaxID=3417969 RepID=UPI003D35165A